MDRAAVQLDDVADDRQAQAEAAGLARRAGVGLAEPLEHERQELRLNADAGVADDDLDVRVDALEPHLHAAALRRELDGVRQQVPDHLLQAIGIAGDRADARIEQRLHPHALRVGGRAARSATALSTTPGSSTGWTSSRILPETMRDTSSTSSTICVSQRELRSTRLERRARPARPASMPPRSSRA